MSTRKALTLVLLSILTVGSLVTAQGPAIEDIDITNGQAVFSANCTACHQVAGAGIPAVFPPLKGHVPGLLAVEGGRRYLVDVVLFGLAGPIAVAQQDFNGLMPPWGHLSDGQLADVLNYVASAWDNQALLQPGFVAFTAEEILAIRGDALDPSAVHAKRNSLGSE